MQPDISVTLDAALKAFKELLKLFRVERIIHLVITILAFLMMVIAFVLYVRSNGVGIYMLSSFFGSTGLITISAYRVTSFFDRAFKLVEDVIRIMAKGQNHEQ